MPATKIVKLNTGANMPTVGLGTWKSAPGEVEHAVEFALKNGYTHIDTAAAYQNEKEVGEGIAASGVARDSIFLTTKLDNPDQKEPEAALESSLSKLGTTYLDLC
jgi:glycerol 2-dehydrogenase (NADP+)